MEIYKIVAVAMIILTVKMPEKWWQGLILVIGISALIV